MTTSFDRDVRDFESFRNAAIQRLRTLLPEDWRIFQEPASVPAAILDLSAFLFDQLSFTLDSLARQAYLATATDREAVILLCRLIGYRLRAAVSASVECRAELDEVQLVPVLIPAGTRVQASNGLSFETREEQVLPAGSRVGSVVLTHGVLESQRFESPGGAFQTFAIDREGISEASIRVEVGGQPWTEPPSLVRGGPGSTIYELERDSLDRPLIRFGDGVTGATPPLGSLVEVFYRIGGGVVGNIPPRSISQVIVDGVLEGSNPPLVVPVRLTNLIRGAGGEDRESVESAKFWAPRVYRAADRAVTLGDYDALARNFTHPVFGQVALAKSRLKQLVPETNTIVLALWSRDSTGGLVEPSPGLKQALFDYFANDGEGAVRSICTRVEVEDGQVVTVDVGVDVQLDGTRSRDVVEDGVRRSIARFFSDPTREPGQSIRLSRLYSAVQATPGVAHLLIQRVVASQFTSEVIGTGDGVTTQVTGVLNEQPLESTVVFRTADDSLVVTDSLGGGVLDGDVDPSFLNRIDYATGQFSFAFSSPPPSPVQIQVRYRTPIEYQRNDTKLDTADGFRTRFLGRLRHVPVIPGTVSITDADGVVLQDDSMGVLSGPGADPQTPSTIDYTTGAFDLRLAMPPAEGAQIAALYRQLLSVNAGDVPIDSNQAVSLGLVAVSFRREIQD